MQNHVLSSRTKGRKIRNALLLSVLWSGSIPLTLAAALEEAAGQGGRLYNAGKQCVIRLLTPLGMRYDDSYILAYLFDKIAEVMLQPEKILETVFIGFPKNILI